MAINIGDVIVYEYLGSCTGMKHSCKVTGFSGEWIIDARAGSFDSCTFRLRDVIVWEMYKTKGK